MPAQAELQSALTQRLKDLETRDEDDRGRNDRREEARSKTHGRESVSCPDRRARDLIAGTGDRQVRLGSASPTFVQSINLALASLLGTQQNV